MSLFQTLSGVFSAQQGKKPLKVQPKKKFEKSVKPAKQPERLVMDAQAMMQAQAEAREIIIEAKDQALRIRQQAEEEVQKLKSQLGDRERDLNRVSGEVDREKAVMAEKQRFLDKIEKEVSQSKDEVDEVRRKLLEKLEDISSMTRDEAKKEILTAYEKKLTADIAKMVKEAEEKANEEADRKSKEILVDAMKHGAHEYVAEYTVSTVKLPDDSAKGRIIGRDGRNIRTFEQATGVDVDLDDTPGEVRLSSFDPVRREVARQSLLRLLRDGRIQPTRIEEYVAKAREEIEKTMFEEGKKLCHAVGVYNLPMDIIATLGRFKFRTSYGQNMVSHTLEETKIGVALAQEVKADVDIVRLGCLLHDIGKVVEGEEEGSHVEIGVQYLKRYRIPQAVIDCVEQHHEDKPFSSAEAVLVYVADAISGARPGARYENYDEYVKRLTKLEEIATSFEGVSEAFALQAGREVRVIVDPKKMGDESAVKLSADIKDRVQKEMTYPGTVTVTVIRETRATQVAK